MVARVHRFQSRRERFTRAASGALAAHIGLFPEDQLPAWARAEVLNALQRLTSPDTEGSVWTGGFVMLSRMQVAAVWDAIRALPPSGRPNQVRHAFDLVLTNLRQDTGEVMLTRREFAERIGTSADNVSTVMGTLVRIGVLRREFRRAEAGHAGGVVWFVNPHVAWNGSLGLRQAEAEACRPPLVAAEAVPGPLLVLMEGGGGKPA